VEPLAEVTSVVRACDLLGRSRASHYRAVRETERRGGLPFGPEPAPDRSPRPARPNALSRAERDRVLAALTEPRFAEKAVAQTWAILLDEGTYLCSISTMYRILREHGMAGNAAARPRIRRGRSPSCSRPGQGKFGRGTSPSSGARCAGSTTTSTSSSTWRIPVIVATLTDDRDGTRGCQRRAV
jgi:putative transposase